MRETTSAGRAVPGSPRVPPAARDTSPTQEIPTQSYAPPRTSGGGNRALPLVLGLAAVLLVLIGIGVIVGLALVGGGSDTKTPQASANQPPAAKDEEPTAQGQSAEASQPSTEQALGVGDPVEVEGIEATLNGVRILPTTDFDQPIQNPDNRFLAADLTFENVSEGAISVSSLLEFVLKNEDGYSASQTFHSQQRELAEGEIGPGQKASGEIVYEVPPESRGLQLDYRPFARGGTYTWAIGDLQGIATAPEPEEAAPPTPQPEEATPPTPEPTSSAPPPSDTEVAEAAEDYYRAVDREDWAYTYANLDAATRALYTEDEWYLKKPVLRRHRRPGGRHHRRRRGEPRLRPRGRRDRLQDLHGWLVNRPLHPLRAGRRRLEAPLHGGRERHLPARRHLRRVRRLAVTP